MDTVLQGLNFTYIYIDDILVASETKAEHKAHLQHVFQHLQQHGLILNLAKYQFGKQEINFLGHHIMKHGITPLLSKTVAIMEFTKPSTVKGLQEFLGVVNFYHCFILSAANIMQPLYQAVAGKPNQLQWTKKSFVASNHTKEVLAITTMLVTPKLMPLWQSLQSMLQELLWVPSSNSSSMMHCQPLAFFSKSLWPVERNYSTFDCELLSLYLSIQKFCYFLEGREFTAYTNHKSLTLAFVKVS